MVTQGVELPVAPTALLTRCATEPFPVALDGGSTASWGCGYALLGFAPRATLRVTANGDAWMREGRACERWQGDPFTLLERFCTRWQVLASPGDGCFAGGVVAALSYELRRWVERLPERKRSDDTLPVLHAAAYDWLLAYSYAERRYQLASARHTRAELQRIADRLEARAAAAPPCPPRNVAVPVRPAYARADYLAAVQAALEYIAAGDVYQVNLAQPFVAASCASPVALFAALQRHHPMPFAAFVGAGDFALISNSPECLLTLTDATVATFPIKGTRPRGTNAAADADSIAQLQRDPKERAEHVMIVDLERNDLGRVCELGSVHVDALAQAHTFPTLHHLISTVSGRLRAGVSLAAVLRATFPGGSITGAPKIRAMEIIDELEAASRGFYTGAIGFIGFDGRAMFNLAIRTAVATPQRLTYHAGGGIVADSIPLREYDETLLKAQPFFTVLNGARD